MNLIEVKCRRINTWLRYHTDYRVSLDLCSVFGCLSLRIEQYLTYQVDGKSIPSWVSQKTFIGTHLEKRLDEVIAYLKIDGGEGDEETNEEEAPHANL